MDDFEKTSYATYNGMNRPALVMGMPIFFVLGMMIVAVLILFTVFPNYGMFPTIIIMGFLGLICFVVKLVCENDPNAIGVIKWRLRGFLLRAKAKKGILSFDSRRDKKNEEYEYKQFLQKFYCSKTDSEL